tara:strand:- start:1086 stop:1517 length:432 start_codon:yes stop_codon:yes gene_type:complete
MRKPLTSKQAKFASLVARGQNKSQAYRSAYDARHMKSSSIKVEANKVSNLPHVADAIKNLRENHEPTEISVETLTDDWIIEKLQEEASDESNPPHSRVRALEVLGKIGGLFDKTVTVTTLKSPEELEKELKEKLSEFFGDSVN